MGKKRIIQKSTVSEEISSKKDISLDQNTKTSPVSSRRAGVIEKGRVYIQASYNNTLISLTDDQGNVLAVSSAGALGFKGPKKATPYAANKVVEVLSDKMKKVGLKDVSIYVKGIGSGREAAIRAVAGQGLNVLTITDVTPVPHNGPRSRKPRRV
jgi:small subunit ribosomal protein S11